jgi:hypothetical protein
MKKIQAIGIKESGKPFRIINQKLFRQELDSLPDGKYRVTVEKLRKNKSLPQLGYLFACVYPLSMQFLNDEVINRHTGEIRMIPALKRDFLSIDMMNYIESIRQHCSEYLGGYIPGPEEQSNINFSE